MIVDVVLDDADFVVVNKAPGQVVHPGAGQREGTLVAGLLARYPQMSLLSDRRAVRPVAPGIVHRLDKGTSGLLVVAKTPEGFVNLSDQLAERLMERTYYGLVQGHVSRRTRRGRRADRAFDAYAHVHGRALGRAAGAHGLRGDHASRSARSRRRCYDFGSKPGRTHQIRVHLATIGHPVVNDLRYGQRRDARLGEERFFLHSTTLAFRHPRTDDVAHDERPAAARPRGAGTGELGL